MEVHSYKVQWGQKVTRTLIPFFSLIKLKDKCESYIRLQDVSGNNLLSRFPASSYMYYCVTGYIYVKNISIIE